MGDRSSSFKWSGMVRARELDASCRRRLLRVDEDAADGLEKMTPVEFSDSDLLIDREGAATSASETVVVVNAVVALGGLITDGRDGSARTVMLELLDTLRRLLLSNVDAGELRFKSDSERRVGREGGMARGGSALEREAWPGRDAGVGEGSYP